MSCEPQDATQSGLPNQAADVLRENTGTSGVVQTAQSAVSTLAVHDIPCLIVGGVAVQWHGYPCVTVCPGNILRRKLPRDLPVALAVRRVCLETWDALQAEF